MFREGLEANGLRASLAMIIKQRVTTRARHDGGPNEVHAESHRASRREYCTPHLPRGSA